jgi:DNA helicase HerA-like ATPase
MNKKEQFIKEINEGYKFKGDSFVLGGAIFDGEPIKDTLVKVPLETLNRHGLIAGATGTGKTKSLQVMAEQLSEKGIPVLLMDLKGDLSGLAKPSPGHPKIDERMNAIGLSFTPKGYPVEMLSLTGKEGAQLRATVSEFGPILLSRILDLNDTQAGIVAVLFKYADDNKLPLIDLKDFKELIKWATGEGKKEFQAEYGRLSTASTGSILRKIVELEQQGAAGFFGEPSFDIEDLMRIDDEGRGIINIIRLTDIQDKPKLFSTFMLQLLAEIYAKMPEQGDADRPELVFFIDEAHLIFKNASKALLEQIESIVKLIRSKGVGIYFVTQNPRDIPDEVLAQLGMKIQHALRAFTAKDRKAIKLAAQNFPISEFYDTEEVLTSLGIGEALVTVLGKKGRPTPLAATLMRAPQSRMDILTDKELKEVLKESKMIPKYNKEIDRDSAYEILKEKIAKAEEEKEIKNIEKKKKREKEEPGVVEKALNSSIGKMIIREVTRSLLGVLGLKRTYRRRRR